MYRGPDHSRTKPDRLVQAQPVIDQPTGSTEHFLLGSALPDGGAASSRAQRVTAPGNPQTTSRPLTADLRSAIESTSVTERQPGAESV